MTFFCSFFCFINKSHEDYQGLQLAYEAMVDVADYTNESTRDYEMRQIINDVQVILPLILKKIYIQMIFFDIPRGFIGRQGYRTGIIWNTVIWLSTDVSLKTVN